VRSRSHDRGFRKKSKGNSKRGSLRKKTTQGRGEEDRVGGGFGRTVGVKIETIGKIKRGK